MKLIEESSYLNDSKKISELRKLTTANKHQENTWFPIAQYNSRTGSYVNAAINLQAITTYNMAYTAYVIDQHFGDEWIDLLAIGNAYTVEDISAYVQRSSIAENIVGYAFSYTLNYMDLQIV